MPTLSQWKLMEAISLIFANISIFTIQRVLQLRVVISLDSACKKRAGKWWVLHLT